MRSIIKPIELEKINAGRRIVRTNIVAHYLPTDETDITTIEVPDPEGSGTHFETVCPELTIDHWEYDEREEFLPCHALLTFSDYFRINMILSESEGFDISRSTERFATMSPLAAKVNVQQDGSYDAALAFDVPSSVHRKYPELFVGLELVESYEHIEGGVTELLVTNLTPDVIDWTLVQYVHVGAKENGMVLRVDPSLFASLPEPAQSVLDGLGIRIEVA